ncbi:MAG: hypothetical protein C4326_02380 [Ignavibacteria bacterium]
MIVRLLLFCVLTLSAFACLQHEPPKRLEHILALKGKAMHEVHALLGAPRVIDSAASPTERIWGYYQVAMQSARESTTQQRTVLVLFRRRDTSFVVEEVRIP